MGVLLNSLEQRFSPGAQGTVLGPEVAKFVKGQEKGSSPLTQVSEGIQDSTAIHRSVVITPDAHPQSLTEHLPNVCEVQGLIPSIETTPPPPILTSPFPYPRTECSCLSTV